MIVELHYSKNVEAKVIEASADIVANIFRARIAISSKPIEIPMEIYDHRRGQYFADGVVYLVYRHYKMYRDSYAIAIVDADAYTPGLNFVFGLAIPSIKTCAVFLPRLRAYASEDIFIERIKKEVVHELGHLLGLEHCRNPGCVMNFSNSVFDVDRKSWRFCQKCESILYSKIKANASNRT